MRGKRVGVICLILLLLIVFLGVILRLVHIDIIGIYFDEMSYLVNALGTQSHGMANRFEFDGFTQNEPRFLWTTWAIGGLFTAFGKSLTLARLPGVVLSALTAIPLYLLGSRISRSLGLLMATIWLMSPWAIVIGRFFREYAYFPFYYVLTFLILVWFAEFLGKAIRKKSINPLGFILGGLLALAPLIYATVGRSTTFKLVLAVYCAGLAYFFYQMLLVEGTRHRFSWRLILSGVCPLAAMLAGILYYAPWAIDFVPSFNTRWIDLALGNNPRNWFYNTGFFSFILLVGLGVAGALALIRRKKFPELFFSVLVFLIYLYGYTFHFQAYFYAPRYAFPVHLWVIPVLALGVWSLYWIIEDTSQGWRKMGGYLLLFMILISAFNPVNTYNAVFIQTQGNEPISGQYLHKFEGMAKKYGEQLKGAPVLCWTCTVLFWFDLADLADNKVKSLWIGSEEGVVGALNFMDNNPGGFLLLDGQRYKSEYEIGYKGEKWSKKTPGNPPKADIELGGKMLKYIDGVDGFYLYRW